MLLSFNIECVKTVIAAILGVMGKNATKANKLQLGLNNLCIQVKITSTILKNFFVIRVFGFP